MRTPRIVVAAVTAVLASLPGTAAANLALQLNANATISSLSAQLLKKPRSQAGNKKNCWDADPLIPAVSGVHYFAYNINADQQPLPANERVITLQSFDMGPGYFGSVEVLVRTVTGAPSFFTPDSVGNFNYGQAVELGLARVTFDLLGKGSPGQIVETDDEELDYDATALDGNPSDERGFEHVRFRTEYLGVNGSLDDRVAVGLMSALPPAAFTDVLPPGGFTPGFLDFGGGNVSSGPNLFSAIVQTPEPVTLALPLIAGVVATRRRR